MIVELIDDDFGHMVFPVLPATSSERDVENWLKSNTAWRTQVMEWYRVFIEENEAKPIVTFSEEIEDNESADD